MQPMREERLRLVFLVLVQHIRLVGVWAMSYFPCNELGFRKCPEMFLRIQ